jgi:transposase
MCGQCNSIDTRELISDQVWAVMRPVLFKIRNTQGPAKRQDDRQFLSAIAHLAQTGKSWRELPPQFGNWHTVYMRFRRWESARVWTELWLEMDDRAHVIFKRVFFEDDGTADFSNKQNYIGIKARLIRAIQMNCYL